MKYAPPGYKQPAFTCPHCDVYASFYWHDAQERVTGAHGPTYRDNKLHIGTCRHCQSRVVWFTGDNVSQMIWPIGVANAPLPHADMPPDVASDYVEARSICALSPRGAAALLRLAIQKLCAHLGEPGKNINQDIGALVAKGLPVSIQQALDAVRVTGNNAVHPGELRLEDNPEIAAGLFGLINLIVDNRIAEPKRIASIYEALPETARRAIGERDG